MTKPAKRTELINSCKKHTKNDISFVSQGGSDPYPLPVCKKCDCIILLNQTNHD
jgi:hypothetical protein